MGSIPEDREILFLPDMFLGAHVERVTGRKMQIWMGECHVHAGIGSQELQALVASNPDAELLIHPECGCASAALYLAGEGVLPAERTHILSTGGMVRGSDEADGGKFIVATETGILHKLRKLNPTGEYIAANEAAVCRYMKTITPENLLTSLREGVFEIRVDPQVAEQARLAIERMIAIS